MDFTEKNEDLKSFKHEPLGFPPYFTHEFMDLGVPENGAYPKLIIWKGNMMINQLAWITQWSLNHFKICL